MQLTSRSYWGLFSQLGTLMCQYDRIKTLSSRCGVIHQRTSSRMCATYSPKYAEPLCRQNDLLFGCSPWLVDVRTWSISVDAHSIFVTCHRRWMSPVDPFSKPRNRADIFSAEAACWAFHNYFVLRTIWLRRELWTKQSLLKIIHEWTYHSTMWSISLILQCLLRGFPFKLHFRTTKSH
jgi:hypothetical protein